MKIYFHCSLTGKEQYLKEYKTIIRILQDLNHEVFAAHIFKKNYKRVSQESESDPSPLY